MDVGPYVALLALALGAVFTACRRQWWLSAFCAISASSVMSRQLLGAVAIADLLTWLGLGALVVVCYQFWRDGQKCQSLPHVGDR